MVADGVTVFSNIEPAANAPYLEWYSDDEARNKTGVTGAVAGVLTLDTTATEVVAAAKLGLYSAGRFPKAGDQIKEYMDDGDTTANENEFAGSFHSIPGKYICTGTCTATADNEGNS